MPFRRFVAALLILIAAYAVPASPPRAQGRGLWFEGARLITGDGSPSISNSAFLVEGDRIAWVGRQGDRRPPDGVVLVDLSGKSVIPALIDGHNHIGLVNVRDGSNRKANYTRDNLIDHLRRYAYYGVGAAMSMGLDANADVAYRLRDEIVPNAARFLTAGKGIAATPMAGPPGEARSGIPYGAATEEAGRQAVRDLHARGVRFVKIWVDDREGTVPKLRPNVYRAIIAEAHRNDQRVLAHLGRTTALEDAKDLLRAGIDGFVHTVRDRDVDEEYLILVKSHPRVWTGPNIPVAGMAPADPQHELFQLHCRNLRKIHQAGMIIGLGTDGTGDGFGVHEQLAAYTECGMTPHEALVAATGTNAQLLDLRMLGTIAAGKQADFVVLDANPLEDILNTRRISRVYLRGKEVDREALRTTLKPAR